MKKIAILLTLLALATPAMAEVRVANEAVVRKLCPNPKARCLVRDNPDFYRDADPKLYERITKPAEKRR
jgi:hypothetical protein